MDQNKAIVRQQAVMKALGFYEGKLDGLWGPKTIEAKLKWERSNRFAPAVPNYGMPFKARDMMPSGTKMEEGMMTCDGLDKVLGQSKNEIKEAQVAAKATAATMAAQFIQNQQVTIGVDGPGMVEKLSAKTLAATQSQGHHGDSITEEAPAVAESTDGAAKAE